MDDGEQPWRRQAECRNHPPDLWYPLPGDDITARMAKRICLTTCPVIDACRAHAHRTGEPDGIWGGETARERSRALGVHARERRQATGP